MKSEKLSSEILLPENRYRYRILGFVLAGNLRDNAILLRVTRQIIDIGTLTKRCCEAFYFQNVKYPLCVKI